jgi:hypothetical protein
MFRNRVFLSPVGRASLRAAVTRSGAESPRFLSLEMIDNLAFPTLRLDWLAGTLALPFATLIQLHSALFDFSLHRKRGGTTMIPPRFQWARS